MGSLYRLKPEYRLSRYGELYNNNASSNNESFYVTLSVLSPRSDSFQDLVHRYFIQLTIGCENKGVCVNPNCATGRGAPLQPVNQAAAKAVLLAKNHSTLCVSSERAASSSLKPLSRNHVAGTVQDPSIERGGGEIKNNSMTTNGASSNSQNTSSIHQDEEPMDTGRPPPVTGALEAAAVATDQPSPSSAAATTPISASSVCSNNSVLGQARNSKKLKTGDSATKNKPSE